MFKYFKELLETLKLIEQHLKNISLCVSYSPRSGCQKAMTTKHWND